MRAIAVIAVIVFHLDEAWLTGGFLGVDVFFVMSGYLITSIILRESAWNEFSLWKFWTRRAKRLLPALMLVVASVLIAGNFLMIRPERTDLPMQALASLFSFANIFFWQTTGGYWAAPAHSLPLLHTWTLSLEEQFYLVLPTLVIALRRFRFGLRFGFVGFLFGCSLLLCIWATPSYRSASFFLLPTRMWELLLGVLLAYWHHHRPIPAKPSRLQGWLPDLGVILVCASMGFLSNDESFPGWRPLVPCVGVLLLLNARASGFSPAMAILRHPSLVFVGKISYSLYLWHWPVFVFMPSAGVTAALPKLILTFVLSLLSYFLVEKPLRFGTRRTVYGWAAVVGLTVFGFGCLKLSSTSPLLSDLGNLDDPRSLTRGHEFEATTKILESEPSSDPAGAVKRPLICLAGSSHARVLGKPVEAYAREAGCGFVSLATSNVGMTSLPSQDAPSLGTVNSKRLDWIRGLDPEVLVLAGMWSNEAKADGFEALFSSILKDLAGNAGRIMVMGQVPMVMVPDGYDSDLRRYLIAGRLSGVNVRAEPDHEVASANHRVLQVVEKLKLPNITFVDPSLALLDGTNVKLIEDGHFLYSDYHHVNDDGARVVFDEKLRGPLTEALQNEMQEPDKQ